MSDKKRLLKWGLVFAGLLLGAASPFLFFFFILEPKLEEAMEDRPMVKAVVVSDAAEKYQLLHDKWPESVDDLTMPDDKLGGSAFLTPEEILDPWGKPYTIEPPQQIAGKVRVYTTAPNGKLISTRPR